MHWMHWGQRRPSKKKKIDSEGYEADHSFGDKSHTQLDITQWRLCPTCTRQDLLIGERAGLVNEQGYTTRTCRPAENELLYSGECVTCIPAQCTSEPTCGVDVSPLDIAQAHAPCQPGIDHPTQARTHLAQSSVKETTL